MTTTHRAEDDGLRFTVLGPVRAWLGKRELDLGSPQQRAVLVALLMRAGRTVTVDDLIRAVWGEQPPPAAVSVLRTYVSRLRKVLRGDGQAAQPRNVLSSTAGGYALRVADDALDLRIRERRAAQARQARDEADLPQAGTLLRAALDGWESVALTGVPGPFAEAERSRLAEARLAVLEARLEVDLELGRHGELVAELTTLVNEHPLHERFCRLLMLALYRCGRQAEALAAFSDARRTLVSELGVEPGPDLKDLHARVLAGDPALASVEQAEPTAAEAACPDQLPSAVPDFVGREEEVGHLRAALVAPPDAPAVPLAVVVGMGGIGKTALAVHAAHGLQEAFPGGRLYADLHGADENPADPQVVLAGFLRALGAVEASLPGDPAERAALYRSLLARRRMLVLLDNAHDTDQVRPLLPGSSSCAVLVTSRFPLGALPTTRRIDLAAFTPDQARTLFARIAGENRVAAEPDATRRVVQSCGGLPLAVRIVASRLAVRSRWSIADLADRLTDERQRLAQLRTESLAVESSFWLGYAQFPADRARVFRLLALPDLPDISLPAAAAALGLSTDTAEAALEHLVDAGMLGSPAVARYQYHDLLRLFARQRAEQEGTVHELDDALARLLDLSLATASAAYRLVRPGHTVPDVLRATTARGLPLADVQAARAWVDRELPGLLGIAVQAGTRGQAGLVSLGADLLWALDALLEERFGWQDVLPACRVLAQAAHEVGDRRAEARVRYMLAGALMQLGQWSEVDEHARIALSLARDTQDAATLAMTLNVRGVSASYRQDPERAVSYLEQAVDVSRTMGDLGIEDYALGNLIQARLLRGDRDASLLAAAHRHLALVEEIDEPLTKSRSLYRLGQVLRKLGRPHKAIGAHRRGLALLGPDGPRYMRAGHLFRLAEALHAAGRPRAAVNAAERAVALVSELKFVILQARILRFLGDVLADLRHTDRARDCWRQAHGILVRLGLPTDDLAQLIDGGSPLPDTPDRRAL